MAVGKCAFDHIPNQRCVCHVANRKGGHLPTLKLTDTFILLRLMVPLVFCGGHGAHGVVMDDNFLQNLFPCSLYTLQSVHAGSVTLSFGKSKCTFRLEQQLAT